MTDERAACPGGESRSDAERTSSIYVLLAGRWYESRSFDGPWTFVRPDRLPVEFAAIPADGGRGATVRAHVAGTPEAQLALAGLDEPESLEVERSTAQFEATYDGAPKFEAIRGTKVSYATNTASQVLRVTGVYYACDNGVWFRSQSPKGPWVVADTIPKSEIAQIPPSSPVYNLTYVEIYASTPEVVYVGYTPGYVGAYPYYGVPVYGTGWYYPPYVGTVYYPRPVTYGFHMTYNPWTGWGVGMTWSSGFFTFGVSFGGGYGGYYPPRGYYPPGGYRPVNCYNCTINTGGGRNNVNIGNSFALLADVWVSAVDTFQMPSAPALVRLDEQGKVLGRAPWPYDQTRRLIADGDGLAAIACTAAGGPNAVYASTSGGFPSFVPRPLVFFQSTTPEPENIGPFSSGYSAIGSSSQRTALRV